MKKTVLFIGLILLVATANTSALNVKEKDFGFGIILGEPTGFSLKYWLDEEKAIDGALAWALSENDSFQLHSDYLIHKYDFFGSDELPAYYGVGALLLFKHNEGKKHHDETIFGFRFPLGVSYLFEEEPMDFFFEFVPVIEASPDVELDLNIAVGLRFFF